MNNEDLERRVATALHELYPEPADHLLTTGRPERRRPVRIAAVVGATAAVLAVGITVGLLNAGSPSNSGNSAPGRSVTSTASVKAHGVSDPAVLLRSAWKLDVIEPSAGRARPASAAVELRLFHDGTMTMACNAATADITAGRMVFHQEWVNNLLLCRDLNIGESKLVYGKILRGTVSWSITSQRLTIARAGVGSLEFTKAGAG